MPLRPNQTATLTLTGISAARTGATDEIYTAIAEAVAEELELLGTLGTGEGGVRALLAAEVASRELRVLKVTVGDGDEVDLEILPMLRRDLPAGEIPCPFCSRRLRVWGRFCTQCGKDLSGVGATGAGLSRAQMLAEVRRGAGAQYDVLGALPRAEGGGDVYFARDRETGGIVSLRIDLSVSTSNPSGTFTVGVTSVLKAINRPASPHPASEKPAISRAPAPAPAKAEAPADTVLEAAQRLVAGEFALYGEMGHRGSDQFFLARELATRRLAVIRIAPGPSGALELDVFRRLPQSVTMLEASEAARLERAFGGGYLLLGIMDEPNASGSQAYFALRQRDGAVVGIRADRAGGSALKVRETGVMRAISDDAPAHVPVIEFAGEFAETQSSPGSIEQTPTVARGLSWPVVALGALILLAVVLLLA